MNFKKRNNFLISGALMALFLIYTSAVMSIDRQPIGPRGSVVGFASINAAVHQVLGVNMTLYYITDWLSLAAIFIMLSFALLGLIQLIKRRHITLVDNSIILLGGFYIIVLFAYLFFEFLVVNYRPVLIDGYLEASYPSSTTMLILCVIPTAMLQIRRLLHNRLTGTAINYALAIFGAAMVIGRLVSGVHWLTDILGSVLLSSALVMLYVSLAESLPAQAAGMVTFKDTAASGYRFK